jgi:hypothetical protein
MTEGGKVEFDPAKLREYFGGSSAPTEPHYYQDNFGNEWDYHYVISHIQVLKSANQHFRADGVCPKCARSYGQMYAYLDLSNAGIVFHKQDVYKRIFVSLSDTHFFAGDTVVCWEQTASLIFTHSGGEIDLNHVMVGGVCEKYDGCVVDEILPLARWYRAPLRPIVEREIPGDVADVGSELASRVSDDVVPRDDVSDVGGGGVRCAVGGVVPEPVIDYSFYDRSHSSYRPSLQVVDGGSSSKIHGEFDPYASDDDGSSVDVVVADGGGFRQSGRVQNHEHSFNSASAVEATRGMLSSVDWNSPGAALGLNFAYLGDDHVAPVASGPSQESFWKKDWVGFGVVTVSVPDGASTMSVFLGVPKCLVPQALFDGLANGRSWPDRFATVGRTFLMAYIARAGFVDQRSRGDISMYHQRYLAKDFLIRAYNGTIARYFNFHHVVAYDRIILAVVGYVVANYPEKADVVVGTLFPDVAAQFSVSEHGSGLLQRWYDCTSAGTYGSGPVPKSEWDGTYLTLSPQEMKAVAFVGTSILSLHHALGALRDGYSWTAAILPTDDTIGCRVGCRVAGWTKREIGARFKCTVLIRTFFPNRNFRPDILRALGLINDV